MKKVELLAPAGSMESLYSAVNMGADAVYLGGNKFSARAYASNFTKENMMEAVNYCHLYNVKVYVAVNILIKENEIDELVEYVSFLYNIGVDALIIQDAGAFKIIKNMFPDFELHASTQMTVHNGEGALFLKDKGFKRIVLSRELSINEVSHISKELNVETEIFVHGALCVCYSGQCLFSSIIGGRSGNRGRCAQPCRLPYNLINKDLNKSKKGYILSPKDICGLSDIEKIIETGTASLKIEGRMKRPEYVAGVVDIYRRAIDSVYENRDFDFIKETKTLLQLFNREGFSKAYFFGNEGKDMMSYNFPKNTGTLLARVQDNKYVKLKNEIQLNDGVRIGEQGYTINSIVKNNKEVGKAYAGDKVILKPAKYSVGDEIYKTLDKVLIEKLATAYSDPYKNKKLLPLKIDFTVNNSFYIESSYDDITFTKEGSIVEKAINKPLSKERIVENLLKTKDTVFQFDRVEFINYEEGFVPMSVINKARRELLEEIEEYILKREKRDINNIKKYKISKDNNKNTTLRNLVCVSTEEQLQIAKEFKKYNLAFNPFMRKCNIEIEKQEEPIYLIVPNIIKEEFNKVCKYIEEHKDKIRGLVTSNYGIISKYHEEFEIVGDYKLNIFNSYSIDFFKDYLKAFCLSIELNRGEIKELVDNSNIPSMLYLYGRPELMVSEYCPIGSIYGGKGKDTPCSGACSQGEYVLKDRKGEEFIIKTDKFCRSHIYNNNPINLIPNLKDIKNIGINNFRIDFTTETDEQVREIFNALEKGAWDKNFAGYTRGHYKRGVE